MRRPRAQVLVVILVCLLLLAPIVWAAAAIWIDGPASRPLAAALASGVVLGAGVLLALVRPFYRAVAATLAGLLLVVLWWSWIEARNDRNWQRDVAELPTAEIHGNLVTVHNVRNFDYRSETDYTPRWETRTYDLDGLRGLDLFMSYWGPKIIAHTIVSWEFENGDHLAISIEARKEQGEAYSALRGFFRQFELYYVVADERDVVRLRTNFRGEDVYLYRLRTPPARARKLLLAYLEEINRLARRPAFYNAFTHNCTTTILLHVGHAIAIFPWDWRIYANGYFDELLHEREVTNQTLPFAELRARSFISPVARKIGPDQPFSAGIRASLPERPPPPPF